jgi:hypothetical protein
MGAFEEIHRESAIGSLTMFDRLIFKRHLSRLYKPGAVRAFLWDQGATLAAFARYASQATAVILAHAERLAQEAGRPSIYLAGSLTRRTGQTKEDLARSANLTSLSCPLGHSRLTPCSSPGRSRRWWSGDTVPPGLRAEEPR